MKAERDYLRKQIARRVLVAKLGLPVKRKIPKEVIINAMNMIDLAERFRDPLNHARCPPFNVRTAQEYLANRLNIG